MTNDCDIVTLYRQAVEDYRRTDDDDDETMTLKQVVLSMLPPADRVIIILYAELGSYRKLGTLMGLSHNTVRKEVLRIRKEIITLYEKHLHRSSADVADGVLHR